VKTAAVEALRIALVNCDQHRVRVFEPKVEVDQSGRKYYIPTFGRGHHPTTSKDELTPV
jgi:hypothetical protein